MKYSLILFPILLFFFFANSQSLGSKVTFRAVDGKYYTGKIKVIQGSQYKIKYDGIDFEAWLAADQFTVVGNATYSSTTKKDDLAGAKISFLGTDGKTYTGIIKENLNDKYKVKYDNYDFETWLEKDQFKVVDYTITNVQRPITTQQINSLDNVGNQPLIQGLQSIFDYGKAQGWTTLVQENQYNKYITSLSEQDKNRLLSFIVKAKTSSAKYFVLISWFTKDPIAVLQKFIDELNAYPESYQQEKCLMSGHRSVIQQWQNTCAVTTVQAFLADLCPRYSWDLKQTNNFDMVANDPNNLNTIEQKELIEKYGVPAAVRGDISAKVIPINGALDDFVAPLLGVHFYTKEVNEPLPTVFSRIRSQLDKGLDVPLLVGFVGTGARHFILAMRYKITAGVYQYLIYDPWDGVCDYVSESNILQGSFAPLLTSFKISVDYYYLTN